ncbi:hypothetical protein Q5O_03425 [Pseudomonas putida JB]|nr:hypothetical protein Q5O_03425 [Pseudomonas putida JB]KMU97279.1 hypothetical protein AC138_02645 [Pseudomonas putida]KMY36906.1 hypothetical protein AA993_03500 [Pseudomonas putida]
MGEWGLRGGCGMKVTRSGVKGEVKMKAGSSVRQLASLMLPNSRVRIGGVTAWKQKNLVL